MTIFPILHEVGPSPSAKIWDYDLNNWITLVPIERAHSGLSIGTIFVKNQPMLTKILAHQVGTPRGKMQSLEQKTKINVVDHNFVSTVNSYKIVTFLWPQVFMGPQPAC